MTSRPDPSKRRRVFLLRALLLRHRALALGLIAAALCLKALVPTGYMPAAGLTVKLCNDASGAAAPKAITIPMKPGGGEAPGDPAGHKAAPACPYAGLTFALPAGAAPALLALVLAFLLLRGFAPVRAPRGQRADWLRPPLRAPPAYV